MNRILLDTNAYARFLAGDEGVLSVLGDAGTVYMSAIVIGELCAGFRGGSRRVENQAELSRFMQKRTVRELDVTWHQV